MHSGIEVILKAEQLGTLFGLPITNSLIMTWIVGAILIIGAYFIGRSFSLKPNKLQAGLEWIFSSATDYVAELLESETLARRLMPLLTTVFLFILLSNELEFSPGIGSLGLMREGVFMPLLRAPTSDLNTTLALAVIVVIVIEMTGVLTLGVLKYGKKYLNFSSPIGFAAGLIELVSNLGRLISFSFRLFGNIFAGEVMVAVAGYFLPYVLPAPLMGFEMFIGVIQALVFVMLTLFFVKLSIMEPHEAH
ncbi:MAG TPA: F0F1 ATP synthase subunit A [Candidatus Paceibacterota bacterium]